jgi:hypothetical protein
MAAGDAMNGAVPGRRSISIAVETNSGEEKSTAVVKTSPDAMDFLEDVGLVMASSRARQPAVQDVRNQAAMKDLPPPVLVVQRRGVRLRVVADNLAVRDSRLHQKPVAPSRMDLLGELAKLTSDPMATEEHEVQRPGPQMSFLRGIRRAVGAARLRAAQRCPRQTLATAVGLPLAAAERTLAVRHNRHPVLGIAIVEVAGIRIDV